MDEGEVAGRLRTPPEKLEQARILYESGWWSRHCPLPSGIRHSALPQTVQSPGQPLGTGGYAEIFPATHRTSGVALKRPHMVDVEVYDHRALEGSHSAKR